MSADRNLLFAVLALQTDMVTRDDLLSGMNAWALAKQRPLGELLVERGALAADERPMLEVLVERQLKRHGSAEASLRALDLSTSARRALAEVPDPQVQASLAAVAGGSGNGSSAVVTAAMADESAGLRYRILRPHAKGGLGEVFVAEDIELKREVALKQIQAQHANANSSKGRFVLEAEITGGLEHPGIVPVYGLGAYHDGRPFYAMRFIRGRHVHVTLFLQES